MDGSEFEKNISRRSFLKKCGQVGLFCMAFSIPLVDIKPAFASKFVPVAPDNPAIVFLSNRCRGCGDCLKPCRDQTILGSYDSNEIVCVHCGQCAVTCGKGALVERDHTSMVINAINDKNKHVVIQTAPATRVTLGEEFKLKAGTDVEGRQVTALKQLGFNAVLDTNFAADLTIMEESAELHRRLTGQLNKPVPQFTSCCPAFVKFCEYFYPEMLNNLSTCKSPQQMMGTLIKSYYAQQRNISASNIFTVSVMPCTAKKFERTRPELKDMDAVLTVRELANMIKNRRIDLARLGNTPYDSLMGQSSGAGTIFGATGGVTEAALRTLYHRVTKQDPPSQLLNFTDVRGMQGVKQASTNIPGLGQVNVAVCHGLRQARQVIDGVKAGASWHFIEFMACPGGCVGGGGQPRPPRDGNFIDRANGLYTMDRNKPVRLSYKNPEVNQLYSSFLGGQPNSPTAMNLLHTSYTPRKI